MQVLDNYTPIDFSKYDWMNENFEEVENQLDPNKVTEVFNNIKDSIQAAKFCAETYSISFAEAIKNIDVEKGYSTKAKILLDNASRIEKLYMVKLIQKAQDNFNLENDQTKAICMTMGIEAIHKKTLDAELTMKQQLTTLKELRKKYTDVPDAQKDILAKVDAMIIIIEEQLKKINRPGQLS